MNINNVKTYRERLKHNNEDLHLISRIETIIRSYRKTVFRMPKPRQSVVLLLSGGLDSVISWEKLMGEHHLRVYPLVVASKAEVQIRVVRYFSSYFRNKYPDFYREPHIMRVSTENADFHAKILRDAHPDVILRYLDPATSNLTLPMSGTNVFTAIWGYLYAQYLTGILAVPVTTIFYGATADDGGHIPSQTYSFMRLMMLALMRFSGNPMMQFGSAFYEETINVYMKKRDVLAYGDNHSVPLHKTYSCDQGGIFHCGTCLSCRSRRYCFDYNHLRDGTVYADQWSGASIKGKLGRLLRRIRGWAAL